MALIIFPASPLPAGMTRTFNWNEHVQIFDSGADQADTAWARPLYSWDIPFKNINEIKQSSLSNFFKVELKGRVTPFLMKDPYDYRVNSVLAVSTNQTQGGSLYLYDVNSFLVRCDTTTIGSLTSALSGYVRLGVEYAYDQDNGIMTVNTIAATDYWTVSSMQYFRKCRFDSGYDEQGIIWNQFSVGLRIRELL